jgi:hypothetical protein
VWAWVAAVVAALLVVAPSDFARVGDVPCVRTVKGVACLSLSRPTDVAADAAGRDGCDPGVGAAARWEWPSARPSFRPSARLFAP